MGLIKKNSMQCELIYNAMLSNFPLFIGFSFGDFQIQCNVNYNCTNSLAIVVVLHLYYTYNIECIAFVLHSVSICITLVLYFPLGVFKLYYICIA